MTCLRGLSTAVAALILLLSSCVGDGGERPSANASRKPASTTKLPGTPDRQGVGEIEIRLIDYPLFQEGFDLGVRVAVDGDIVVERKLADFVYSGEGKPLHDWMWSTRFALRPGAAVLLSDLSIGVGPGPEPPDFVDPCRSEIMVDSGQTLVVNLDWRTGCLNAA